MNEYISKIKLFWQENYKIIFIIICILGICFCIYRLMSGSLSDNGQSINSVGKQLDTAAEEQQRAENAIETVQSGINDSLEQIGNIEQSNSNIRKTVNTIRDKNTDIDTAITKAVDTIRGSQQLITDSERRIAESLSIIQAVRRTAE